MGLFAFRPGISFQRLSRGTFAFALLVGVSACSDDGNQATGETETGTGTGTGTGAMTTASMTTASMTTAGVTAGNDSSTGMPSDSTGMPGASSTGGEQTCEECGLAECGDQITECIGVEECACWLMCLSEGNEPMDCGMECMGPPPDELDPVQTCIEENCTDACSEGGSTDGGSSSSGGGGDDGAYEECDPLGGNDQCTDPLTCNMFLGYCTLQGCKSDDDCPTPASGDVEPSCSQFDNCVLTCDQNSTCPDGMSCNFQNFCDY